jgi:hypothetical protein
LTRPLSIVAALLANLLLLACAALWAHRHLAQFHTGRGGETRHVFFDSRDGVLSIQWMNHPSPRKPKVGRFGVEPFFRPDEMLADYGLARPSHNFIAATAWSGDFKKQDPASDWSYRITYVRWWLLTAVAGALWLSWLISFRRARRRGLRVAAGRCPTCGYDLRASPNRCPECGRASTG